MGSHLVDGKFQSDKYPTCPPGKVPLSVEDPMAQDLLWQYAQRRRAVDAEFSSDLETTLLAAGYKAPSGGVGKPLTTAEILALKALADAASPGPWIENEYYNVVHTHCEGEPLRAVFRLGNTGNWQDFVFGAAARQGVPRLTDDLIVANLRLVAWERLYGAARDYDDDRGTEEEFARFMSALTAARALGLDV